MVAERAAEVEDLVQAVLEVEEGVEVRGLTWLCGLGGAVPVVQRAARLPDRLAQLGVRLVTDGDDDRFEVAAHALAEQVSALDALQVGADRSEERRVGKECG